MILAIAGGVGGAKMAEGLVHALPPDTLSVLVNVADDFDHHGLRICPDLDTCLYTLSGLANREFGWGVAGDTRHALGAMARLGADPWFILGDMDLATHILRTERLRGGQPLSRIMADFAAALGIPVQLVPVTDDRVATMVSTPDGDLEFQGYFVRRRQQDDVLGVRFAGIEDARPAPGVLDAIATADTIVFCPSNPIVSVGPVLAVPGIRDALAASPARRIAVSPIIGGKALKGPADRMMATLGHESSALGVARLYVGLIDGFILDHEDADLIPAVEALGMRATAMASVMGDTADRARFAREALAFAATLTPSSGR